MEWTKKKNDSKCDVQMTAMIDVVFQLLIFFMLSFKIVTNEGDFNVKMPLATAGPAPETEPENPPITVRLTRQANGDLAAITLNGQPISSFPRLRERIIQVFGVRGGPGSNLAAAEVEFDCDYDLRYEHVIQAITAVSGYTDQGRVVKLVEKIKFSPPRAADG